MKNNFHNDVDYSNLDIADKILNDSAKINTDNIFDENLMNNITSGNIISNKKFQKRKLYAFVSAVAACAILAIGITYYNNGFIDTKTSDTIVFYSDINDSGNTSIASDYSEIYDRLKKVSTVTLDGMINQSAKSSSSSTESSMMDSSQSSAESLQSSGYYDTNEQTENVHEGDIVKTDGKYIYTLTYKEKKGLYKVIITKADGMNLKNVSQITFKNDSSNDTYIQISEIYVNNDTLIAIGNNYFETDYDSLNGTVCCLSSPEDGETIIYTYDISDRSTPKLISKNSQDGNYVSSRMSNGFLYTISNKNMYELTREECVPSVNGKRLPSDCVYLPQHIDNAEYTIITVLDTNSSADFSDSIAVAGGTSTIYASQDNLYLISVIDNEKDISDTSAGKKYLAQESDLKIYNNKKVKVSRDIKNIMKEYYEDIDVEDITAYRNTSVYKSTDSMQIIKYSYSNKNVEFVGDTTIDGYSYDNMCFDEKDDYLRLVSTESNNINIETRLNYYDKNGNLLFYISEQGVVVKSYKDTNNVFVLDENLNTKAEIENLAKGESIYSARFLGDYGYFVTYENTDPLFSVDFSDIENPKIIGKLKLPGFSDYLHFYTENKLFGFGMNTNENSGNWECLKLEMYDISDGKASTESKKLLKDYEYSSALYNYKGIMVDSTKGLIGFIASSYTDYYEDYEDKSSYLLYTYKNNSFQKILELDLENAYDARGFYIGDYLYVVDPDFGIRVLNLKTYNDDQKVEVEKF